MIESGYCLGFLLEARTEVRLVDEVRGKNLDSHVATQGRLQRLVDDGHATATDYVDKLVCAKLPPDEVVRRSGAVGRLQSDFLLPKISMRATQINGNR